MRKKIVVTAVLVLFVIAGSLVSSSFADKYAVSLSYKLIENGFAGSEACMSCHKSIYDSFVSTAHNLTSRPAAAEFIKGSIKKGENRYSYNPFVFVQIEKKGEVFYQTAYAGDEPYQSKPFDVVIGSGRKGQTYLYWNGNNLFQLPVSYYVPGKSWCNSPGYFESLPYYNRIISGRCIECHGSHAKFVDGVENVTDFDRKSIIYGVNCERCHGPALDHVNFHQLNPRGKKANYILIKKQMSISQSLDVCGLCHSGIREPIQPVFSFKTGDNLKEFSLPTYNEDSSANLDVHGNQLGLFLSSTCYKKAMVMNCSSCHNVHNIEINNPKLFSSKCLNCHGGIETAQVKCGFQPPGEMTLENNCIDCHMPVMPSKNIFLQTNDPVKSSPDFVRSHRIAIYKEATDSFLNKFNSDKKKK
jgi:hypothetical protein